MSTRTRARDNGGEPLLYYVCSRARKDEGPRPCRATKNHRAEALEREVVALVDGKLLADRETLERWIERAMGTHGQSARRDAAASESACEKALEEVARERDRLVRLYTTGRVGDAEYDAHAGELDDREAGARAELDRNKREAEEVRVREDNRRAILEAYGTGLQLGLHYFPPHLRRQVYGALGITAYVSPDGAIEIEGYFDADVIRLTCELEEYALALREAEGRINGYVARSTEDGWENLERELHRVRDEQTPRLSPARGRG